MEKLKVHLKRLGFLNTMMNKVYRLSLMNVGEQGGRQAPSPSGRQLYGNRMKTQSAPMVTLDNACRTANGFDINGFGQLKDGRGNICPVTIILPTLAMQTKERIDTSNAKANIDLRQNPEAYKIYLIDEFMKLLDKKIHEAKDMLIERFDWICSQDPSSAQFMYENRLMEGYIPEEGIKSALKHGTLAVG